MILPHTSRKTIRLRTRAAELVEQLLEYKKYQGRGQHFGGTQPSVAEAVRAMADDLPPRRIDPGDQPIHEIELWDVVSAFGRIIRDTRASKPSNIVYDDTPIHVYMNRIHSRLVSRGRVAFSEMFESGMHKSALIGVFLAILELVRHHSVRTEQLDTHGEIWIVPGQQFDPNLELTEGDEYGNRNRPLEEDLPSTAQPVDARNCVSPCRNFRSEPYRVSSLQQR